MELEPMETNTVLRNQGSGQPGWLSGLVLPLARGVIPDPGLSPTVGLPAWSLLLLLPVSLPAPLSLSLMNK